MLAGTRRSAQAKLQVLQATYPGPGKLDYDKTMIERKWNVHYGGLAWAHTDGDFYFHAGRFSPLYKLSAPAKSSRNPGTFCRSFRICPAAGREKPDSSSLISYRLSPLKPRNSEWRSKSLLQV